jgi:hypothetical protein
MLIAITISALIVTGIFSVVQLTFKVNWSDKSRMEAIKQVENAVHWIDRDAQMSTRTLISSNNPTMPDFPLQFYWVDFNDNERHVVIYDIADGVLQRSETINEGTAVLTQVAKHIVAAESNYDYNGQILMVNLTATVNSYSPATESRTIYVIPPGRQ